MDQADLLAQLEAWKIEVNTKLPSRATGVTPATRMTEDRARLRPLKVAPTDLALRIPILVGPTGYVLHGRRICTRCRLMPSVSLARCSCTGIGCGSWQGASPAVHSRLFVRGAKSTLPEHRVEAVARVSGKRGKRYLMREHLLEVGG